MGMMSGIEVSYAEWLNEPPFIFTTKEHQLQNPAADLTDADIAEAGAPGEPQAPATVERDTTCSITMMRRYKGIAIRLSISSLDDLGVEGEVRLFQQLQTFIAKYEANCDPALYDPAYNVMAQKPPASANPMARIAELEAENARLKETLNRPPDPLPSTPYPAMNLDQALIGRPTEWPRNAIWARPQSK